VSFRVVGNSFRLPPTPEANMTTRVKLLKVKIKSLAAEARIIRQEERRALGRRKAKAKRRDMGRGFPEPDPDYSVFLGRDLDLHGRLRGHRLADVRREQRSSLLAYAFLRGRPLAAVEPKRGPEHEWQAAARWKRVEELVKRFGTTSWVQTDKAAQADAFLAWKAPAVQPVA
jgi:hypothetical protein